MRQQVPKRILILYTRVGYSDRSNLPKRVESVPQQLFGERQHPARGLALYRPFHDFAVILERSMLPSHIFSSAVAIQYNVRNITGPETAAHCELNVLQQTPPSPLGLEPFHLHGRLASLGLPAATADANRNLADHQALCDYGMAYRAQGLFKLLEIIYHEGYTIKAMEEVAPGSHTS
jgi:hypothetical protein